jgi:hypothetical protein
MEDSQGLHHPLGIVSCEPPHVPASAEVLEYENGPLGGFVDRRVVEAWSRERRLRRQPLAVDVRGRPGSPRVELTRVPPQ